MVVKTRPTNKNFYVELYLSAGPAYVNCGSVVERKVCC